MTDENTKPLSKKHNRKSLQEVEDSIIFEVHCNECGYLLGYYIELPERRYNEAHTIIVKCWDCRKKEIDNAK